MIKKTLIYTDIDGTEVKEDAYFHLSQRDLRRMIRSGEFDRLQTIAKKMTELTADTPASEVMNTVMDAVDIIVKASYGKRVQDEDRTRFIKNEKSTELFMDSEAYDALVDDLIDSPESLTEFMTDLFPDNARKQAEDYIEKHPNDDAVKNYLEAKAQLEAKQEITENAQSNVPTVPPIANI